MYTELKSPPVFSLLCDDEKDGIGQDIAFFCHLCNKRIASGKFMVRLENLTDQSGNRIYWCRELIVEHCGERIRVPELFVSKAQALEAIKLVRVGEKQDGCWCVPVMSGAQLPPSNMSNESLS